MKKFFIIAAVACVGILVAHSQSENAAANKVAMAQYVISKMYVDSVNSDKVAEDGIRGMLEKLDPHSTYTNAEDTKALNEPLQGNFSGIGIQFNMAQDTLYVVNVISGGPSEKVGIIAGDRIVAVNDTAIAGVKMKNSEVMRRLRGPKGTNVKVSVLRAGNKKLIPFNITRDNIPIYSIDASYMVAPEIGYVRLSRFGAETDAEFRKAIAKLKGLGMKSLVLDLQDNGGGFLEAAIALSTDLLQPGQKIVYTEGTNSPRNDAIVYGEGVFRDGKVVVLLNEYSASASEILSGAIQDWDRGVIVGRRSFGKGLVQRPFGFGDGSMMRLTVARYYTPSGRCIQKPYTKGDNKSYESDIAERFDKGEFMHSDSIHFADSLRYRTLHNGRTIYGGGGIMPDVFIPLDTTKYTKYHRALTSQGIPSRYVIKYIDKNRKQLKKKYKNIDAFKAGYEVSQDMLDEISKMGEEAKIETTPEEIKSSAHYLAMQVKAIIANDLFDNEAFYVIMNESNEHLIKAVEILQNEAEYNKLLMPKN